ncbi:MAG: hypothetical protein LIP77_11605, partial [Planctomycetes bacterium]|nr:hypothetical protein [Planctomycetota bacterium]
MPLRLVRVSVWLCLLAMVPAAAGDAEPSPLAAVKAALAIPRTGERLRRVDELLATVRDRDGRDAHLATLTLLNARAELDAKTGKSVLTEAVERYRSLEAPDNDISLQGAKAMLALAEVTQGDERKTLLEEAVATFQTAATAPIRHYGFQARCELAKLEKNRKKRHRLLQAIIDEISAGPDADALRNVAAMAMNVQASRAAKADQRDLYERVIETYGDFPQEDVVHQVLWARRQLVALQPEAERFPANLEILQRYASARSKPMREEVDGIIDAMIRQAAESATPTEAFDALAAAIEGTPAARKLAAVRYARAKAEPVASRAEALTALVAAFGGERNADSVIAVLKAQTDLLGLTDDRPAVLAELDALLAAVDETAEEAVVESATFADAYRAAVAASDGPDAMVRRIDRALDRYLAGGFATFPFRDLLEQKANLLDTVEIIPEWYDRAIAAAVSDTTRVKLWTDKILSLDHDPAARTAELDQLFIRYGETTDAAVALLLTRILDVTERMTEAATRLARYQRLADNFAAASDERETLVLIQAIYEMARLEPDPEKKVALLDRVLTGAVECKERRLEKRAIKTKGEAVAKTTVVSEYYQRRAEESTGADRADYLMELAHITTRNNEKTHLYHQILDLTLNRPDPV